MALIKECKGTSPKFGEDCWFAENATIVGDVVMGDQCSVWFNAVVRGDVNLPGGAGRGGEVAVGPVPGDPLASGGEARAGGAEAGEVADRALRVRVGAAGAGPADDPGGQARRGREEGADDLRRLRNVDGQAASSWPWRRGRRGAG